MKLDLDQLFVIPINEKISKNFIDLMLEYTLSHNLDLPDALIASTAIIYDLELYTLNKKHFRYIDNLKHWKV
ncbi:MAG: PIN domain-containing protein [Bacteroidota bacterium]